MVESPVPIEVAVGELDTMPSAPSEVLDSMWVPHPRAECWVTTSGINTMMRCKRPRSLWSNCRVNATKRAISERERLTLVAGVQDPVGGRTPPPVGCNYSAGVTKSLRLTLATIAPGWGAMATIRCKPYLGGGQQAREGKVQ